MHGFAEEQGETEFPLHEIAHEHHDFLTESLELQQIWLYVLRFVVADERDYRLGGSFFDGKGQPGQVSAVSHGSSTARFNGINVINTARSLG